MEIKLVPLDAHAYAYAQKWILRRLVLSGVNNLTEIPWENFTAIIYRGKYRQT